MPRQRNTINTMRNHIIVLLLFFVGCVDGDDTAKSVEAPDSAPETETFLQPIPEEPVTDSGVGSAALKLMAAVRRLDEMTAHYAITQKFSPQNVKGIKRDLEDLKKASPHETEVSVYNECLAVIEEVRGWTNADQPVDLLPAKKRIKALQAALRIDPHDFHNEPLMRAYSNVAIVVAAPKDPGVVQKLDEADKLAAAPGTDETSAKLTQEFLAKLREFVQSPSDERRKEVLRLSHRVVWDLKLDSYRRLQVWRADRDEKRSNGPLNRLRSGR